MKTLRALAALTCLSIVPLCAAEPPNVVLVMTDDQGYGDLGCHGNPVVKTPNLDALHAESIRLTNFHVDPTCSPTRAALMTGRYSPRTGVWHTIMGRSLLRRDEVTIADIFSKAGYRTGIFGKWHLGDNYPFRPQHRGFGTSLVHGGGGIGQTPDQWKNDYFDDVFLANGKPVKTEGYCTKVFFDHAIAFIEKSEGQPFLCYIPTNVAHGPYLVADEYSKPYREAGVKGNTAKFYGMITELDENVGRLLRKLKTLGIDRETIVIFMTDNGTAAGHFSAGMRGRKGSEFDGGHRVPFFIRWPGRLKGGRDIDRLTAHIDVLPTLVDLCGIQRPRPGQRRGAVDGATLRPLLEGSDTAIRDWPARTLFVQSHRIEHPEPWRKSAVMTRRWRLVNGKHLFDMQADPGQKRDVAKETPDVVLDLRSRYEAWYGSCDEKFDTYCEIVLGSPRENPTTLTCHDWHSGNVPWHQRAVSKTPAANGFWAVEVEVPGIFEVTLRTRPAGDDSYALRAGKARIKVGDVERETKLTPGSSATRLEITLPAGKSRLQTWIEEDGRPPRGAFFVTFRRR